MPEQIKSQIRARLEGFEVKLIRADFDSWIFDTDTMVKISELSKDFNPQLVVEVIQDKYQSLNKTIDSISIKREVEAYRDKYPVVNISSREEVVSLSNDMGKLFDELVDPSPESGHLVINVDEWIKRIDSMKEKYGYRPFTQMYEVVYRVKKMVWDEGLTEEEALREFHVRQEKDYRDDLSRSFERMNSHKSGSSLASRLDEIQKEMKNFHPNIRVTGTCISDFHVGIGRSLRVNNNKGSGGHGYDISSNGSRHKKVVTGKSGNQYPVPKRRGVR
jgi:hypothetical protein